MPGTPVLAVIDTETTGFNKRYDRLIELAAVRADAHFTPVGFWHTLLNPDGKAIKNPIFTALPTTRPATYDSAIDTAYNHSMGIRNLISSGRGNT